MSQNPVPRVPGSQREVAPQAAKAQTVPASDAARKAAVPAECQVFQWPVRSPPPESSDSAKPRYLPRKREDVSRWKKNRVHENRVWRGHRSGHQPKRLEWRRIFLPALHQRILALREDSPDAPPEVLARLRAGFFGIPPESPPPPQETP